MRLSLKSNGQHKDVQTEGRSPSWQAGLDSLGAVELRSAMCQHFSVQLPATVAFDYPTPAALADCIASRLPVASKDQLTEFIPQVNLSTR